MPIVYIDGVFDLIHVAHVNFMRNVKLHAAGELNCDVKEVRLYVGVVTDEQVESYKRTPIVPHKYRVAMVQQLKCVDAVVSQPPLVLTEEFIELMWIDLVYHGDDMSTQVTADGLGFFDVPIRLGIMRTIPYDCENTGMSTTNIMRACHERVASSQAAVRPR